MNKVWRINAVALAILMLVTIVNCRKGSEEETIRKVITNIQKAAEEKDASEIMDNVSKNYGDPQGTTYDTLQRLLRGYFLIYPKITVYVSHLQIKVRDTSASAIFQALLTSGQKKGSLADVIPQNLCVYQFDVLLSKESSNWKVISASWTPVDMDGESGDGE